MSVCDIALVVGVVAMTHARIHGRDARRDTCTPVLCVVALTHARIHGRGARRDACTPSLCVFADGTGGGVLRVDGGQRCMTVTTNVGQ